MRRIFQVIITSVFSFIFLVFIFISFTSERAQAFPEMIRHGYINCTSCHASDTGGDLLTDYGRALSKELLSRGQFFFENRKRAGAGTGTGEDESEQLLSGTVDTGPWFQLGGDIRLAQVFRETSNASSARFFLMQADIAALVTDRNRARAYATIGRYDPHLSGAHWSDFVISREHWLSYALGDEPIKENISARVGRFYPAFGIHFPEHIYFTRRLLGFDQGQETYNAEIARIGDEWSWTANYVFAHADQTRIRYETGLILQATRALGSTHKVGVNVYWNRTKDNDLWESRSVYGAFGLFGFTPSLYALIETDAVHSPDTKWGFIGLSKLGWEFSKGAHAFTVLEYANLDVKHPDPRSDAHSVGLQYFPRPHWDLSASLRRERNAAIQDEYQTLVLLLMHYYL